MPGKQPASGRPDPWESGLVIIDKPGGMTSHDVVARVRRLAHTRRVGHAGTLDPMATGVLVIGVEKATRLLGHLMVTEKSYLTTIRLGQSTSTDDAEGEPTGGSPAGDVTREALDTEIARLTGEILQVPSSVSAIKVNGQRAYKLTRAGEAPELAARPVTIYEFRVIAIRREADFLDVDALVRCSSGTYVRALARDLGAALGTGGHLTALRRTAVGPYTLAQAHPLKDLETHDQSPERSEVTAPAPAPRNGQGQDAPAPAPRNAAGQDAPAPAPRKAAGQDAPAPGPAATDETGRSREPRSCPWVTPLAAAAAAAFPRIDLTAGDARRLAQGARLPLSTAAPSDVSVSAAAPSDEPTGAAGHGATADLAPGATAPGRADAPFAAFAPDGTLVALVTVERGEIRSLAVFVDAATTPRDA